MAGRQGIDVSVNQRYGHCDPDGCCGVAQSIHNGNDRRASMPPATTAACTGRDRRRLRCLARWLKRWLGGARMAQPRTSQGGHIRLIGRHFSSSHPVLGSPREVRHAR